MSAYQNQCLKTIFRTVILLFCWSSTVKASDATKSTREQVQEILEHFKQKDPLGIPNLPIPDPLDVEPFQEKISGVRLKFENTKAHKLSKFRIDHVTIDLQTMEVSVGLTVPQVTVEGDYNMLTPFSRKNGPFTVHLTDVYATGKTKLEISPKQKRLQTTKVDVDLTVDGIKLQFQKLGYMERVFQGILNMVGSTVFNTIRKKLLSQYDAVIVDELNKALQDLPFQFSHSVAPIDVALRHASCVAKEMKYDPFELPPQRLAQAGIRLNTTGMVIYGLSKIRRGEHVLVSMRNNTMEAKVQLATEKLSGSTRYHANLFDYWEFEGEFAFQVDYVKVGVIAAQPLNLDEKLVLKDIDLEVGKVSITPLSDGSGAFAERILWLTVALVSATVRNLVACVAEEPIRLMVQQALADLDLEKLVYDNLVEVDASSNRQSKCTF